jgi:hypothetical protein
MGIQTHTWKHHYRKKANPNKINFLLLSATLAFGSNLIDGNVEGLINIKKEELLGLFII